MSDRDMDRRQFLVGAAGAGGLAAVLAACGGANHDTGATTETTAESSSAGASTGPSGLSSHGNSSIAPAYTPYTGVKPDLPAGDHGIPAGFYHYPANPPSFVTDPVGNGGDVSIMIEGATSKNPRGSNPWWQALEKAWNVRLTFNRISSTSYTQKLQTSIAGDDLGDFTQIPNGGVPGSGVPQLPQVLEKMFTDLTPYLAGDAINDYPGLASIPTSTWRQISTIDGKIWGIAQPRPAASPILNYLQSVFEKTGASADISDGKDFESLFKSLTNVKEGRYAMGQVPTDWLLPLVLEMMEAPNNWTMVDGRFSSVYESDQMPDALDEVAKLWKAGYIHPDSFSAGGWYAKFKGGNLGVYSQHFPGWTGATNALPDDTVRVVRLPKWHGGGPAPQYLSVPGYADPVGIKKTTDEKRITELLRIANYVAAPFGTSEYLLVNKGVKGRDYTLDGTDPVTTKSSSGDFVSPTYLGSQSSISLYANGKTPIVKSEHEFLSDVLPSAVEDPSLGLYSETEAAKGAAARKKLHDVQNDIIQGRKSVSDWSSAVAEWKAAVGGKVAIEYATAHAKGN